jgi:hypothetical protein
MLENPGGHIWAERQQSLQPGLNSQCCHLVAVWLQLLPPSTPHLSDGDRIVTVQRILEGKQEIAHHASSFLRRGRWQIFWALTATDSVHCMFF